MGSLLGPAFVAWRAKNFKLRRNFFQARRKCTRSKNDSQRIRRFVLVQDCWKKQDNLFENRNAMTTTREELWNLKSCSLEYATLQVFGIQTLHTRFAVVWPKIVTEEGNRVENRLGRSCPMVEKENCEGSPTRKRQMETSSGIRKLQASLFPVQSIYGEFAWQEIGVLYCSVEFFPGQSDEVTIQNRFGLSKKDLAHVPNFFKYRESLEASEQSLSSISGVTQETARWPTECQVHILFAIKMVGKRFFYICTK